jgi:hypothetical protein
MSWRLGADDDAGRIDAWMRVITRPSMTPP